MPTKKKLAVEPHWVQGPDTDVEAVVSAKISEILGDRFDLHGKAVQEIRRELNALKSDVATLRESVAKIDNWGGQELIPKLDEIDGKIEGLAKASQTITCDWVRAKETIVQHRHNKKGEAQVPAALALT